jgi:[ribosomal protein S5]-alanine N-acetyltransferase
VPATGVECGESRQGSGPPILTTKRLRLRRFDARDLAGLHACFGDAEAMRYWNFPPSQSEAESARRLKTLEKRKSPYSFLAWAVADKKSNECIGMVTIARAHNPRLEVGYILCPKRQGKGLMSEAMRALLAYCFEDLDVRCVQGLIHPDNTASIRLVKRLGFHCEGVPSPTIGASARPI